MKNLAILLLALSPFMGFSQNENNGFAYVKNSEPAINSTSSNISVKQKTSELVSYLEDDLKLYDGSYVLENYLLEAEDQQVRTIRYIENPKVYYEVEVEFSDDKTVKIQRKINKAFFEKLVAIQYEPQ